MHDSHAKPARSATGSASPAGHRPAPFPAVRPRLRALDGGAEAFEAICGQIRAARRTITVRAFVWRDDEAGNRIARLLLAAADRGVHVSIAKDRVGAAYELAGGNHQSLFHKDLRPIERFQTRFLHAVYGGWGSIRQRPNPLARALAEHPRVRLVAETRFDHAKLFVFDERVAILGSMGIGDNHLSGGWRDVMVEVSGAEAVSRLRRRERGEVPFDPRRRLDFLLHSRAVHGERTCPMLAERLALIHRARRRITVEMAYLGDRRFTRALTDAVRRGVSLFVCAPAQADIIGDLNRATCAALLEETGAPRHLEIVLSRRMIHAKAVVVDGRFVDVGSANFTPLSHGVYDEVNLYADDADLAREIEALARAHARDGERVRARLPYRRIYHVVERAIVGYQARRGA